MKGLVWEVSFCYLRFARWSRGGRSNYESAFAGGFVATGYGLRITNWMRGVLGLMRKGDICA